MTCLDNIVTLGICDDDVSTSGLTLMQAGGMSPKNLSNIAEEQYVQGVKLANVKKDLAITLLRNDFIGVLRANNIATTITDPIYNTSSFIPGVDMGLYPGERGVTLHGVDIGYRGTLKQRKITGISCYPLANGTGYIQIVDVISGVVTTTPFAATFVANRINTFAIDYTCQNTSVRVVIDNTSINFASAPITCLKGCNSSMPNTCAWADGWNGTTAVKSEGYGINVMFKCHCDYDQLLCDMSQSFIGELIWLKWQELVYDDQYKSNRFNGWTTYNREDIQSVVLPELRAQYVGKWNDFVGGLYNILKTYRDDCLNCRGIRQVTNI